VRVRRLMPRFEQLELRAMPSVFTLSSGTYSTAETGSAAITVKRNSTVGAETVQLATSNGTATAGSDYTAVSTTVQFVNGADTVVVNVPILADTNYEANETVNLTLSNPSSGSIGSPGIATLTITNDDTEYFSFTSTTYSVSEGTSSVYISLVRNSTLNAETVWLTTSNGTATAGQDYQSYSQAVTFANGSSTAGATITLFNDLTIEANETVNLTLSSPSFGALGTPSVAALTINDNDEGGRFHFSSSSYFINEGDGTAVITVVRTKLNSSNELAAASVAYSTSNGSATASSDYSSASGWLNFSANVSYMTFSVPILTDSLNESDETVNLQLSSPTAGSLSDGPTTATLSIHSRWTTTTALTSSANPSVSGQTVTFTATVTADSASGLTPTGTVTFKDGTTTLGIVTLNASGVATFSTSTLSVAGHSITAVYNGTSSTFIPSTSSTVTQTVNKASTATVVVSSTNPSVFGQSVTLTASVTTNSPGTGTPTGTVTFMDGATAIGTATLSAGGVATLMKSDFSVGTHNITAVYNGASKWNGSTSTAVAQVINKAATSISLATSANAAVYGQALTYTATVLVIGPGNGIPTGSVRIYDGAQLLGTVSLNSNGLAVLSNVVFPDISTHTLTAIYDGDTSFQGSTSDPLYQIINQASTTVTLTASSNPAIFGQAITYTATVAVVAPGTGTPTGSVLFRDGLNQIGWAPLNSSGVATVTIYSTLASPILDVGSHNIIAIYAGSAYLVYSASNIIDQSVTQAATTTSLTASSSSSSFGQSFDLIATVTPTSSTSLAVPGGTVTFKDGAAVLGTAALNSQGVATLSVSSLAVGAHPSLTAVYGSTTQFGTSTSTALSHSISIADPSVVDVSLASGETIYGHDASFTATVSSSAGVPTGTVGFYLNDSATPFATATLDSEGVASVTAMGTALLPLGTSTVRAVYSGSSSFPSASSSLTVSNSAETTIALTSQNSNSQTTNEPGHFAANETITLIATVGSVVSGAGIPTGSVTFRDEATGRNLGTVGINPATGQAQISFTSAQLGGHNVSASYSGSLNSSSSSQTSTVFVGRPLSFVSVANVTSGYSYFTTGESLATFAYGDASDHSNYESVLQATISWGDGWSNVAPTLSHIAGTNTYSVGLGIHHYSHAGVYTGSIKVRDNTGAVAKSDFTATATDASIDVQPMVAPGSPSTTYKYVVAKFSVVEGDYDPTHYAATLDRDGTGTTYSPVAVDRIAVHTQTGSGYDGDCFYVWVTSLSNPTAYTDAIVSVTHIPTGRTGSRTMSFTANGYHVGFFANSDDIVVSTDSATASSGMTLRVVDNDSLIAGQTVSITNTTAVSSGTLTLNADNRSYTYKPVANATGMATFSYTLTRTYTLNGNPATETSTGSVTLHLVNPQAVNDTVNVGLSGRSTAIDVLANDTDVSAGGYDIARITKISAPAYGIAQIDYGASTVSYQVDPAILVSAPTFSDSFTYTVMDYRGVERTATVYVTGGGKSVWASKLITASNNEWNYSGYDWSARQALGYQNTAAEDDLHSAWAALPMNGPTDEDGNVIRGEAPQVLKVGFDFGNDAGGNPITGVHALGVVIRESNGNGFVRSVAVIHSGGSETTVWAGPMFDDTKSGAVRDFLIPFNLQQFNYYDIQGVSITVDANHDLSTWEEIDAVRLITDTPTNFTPPTAVPTIAAKSLSVSEDSELVLDPANANWLWGQFTAAQRKALLKIEVQTAPQHGYFSIDTNQTASDLDDDIFTYTPDPDYHGADSVQYKVTDIWGNTRVGSISLTVNAVNDEVIAADVYNVFPDGGATSYSVNVAQAAFDVDADTLTVSSVDFDLSQGSATYSGGSITFTPNPAFVGKAEVGFTLSDGHGSSSSAVLTILVYPKGAWADYVTSASQYSSTDNSAMKAAGAPDTFFFGDQTTAWAPNTADGSAVTLDAYFPAQPATGVMIRETNATGFVTSLVVHYIDGTSSSSISVTDSAMANHISDIVVPLPASSKPVKRVAVTVNPNGVVGDWEEIDAIRLVTAATLPSGTIVANSAPTAATFSTLATKGVPLVLNLTQGSSDADGDAVSLYAVLNLTPGAGSLSLPGNNTAVFTPATSFVGLATYEYVLTDNHGGTVHGQVKLRIDPGVFAASILGATSGDAAAVLGSPEAAPGGWRPNSSASGEQSVTVGFSSATPSTALAIFQGGTKDFVTRIDVFVAGSSIPQSITPSNSDPLLDPSLLVDLSNISGSIEKIRIVVDPELDGRIDAVKLLTTSYTVPSAPSASAISASTTQNVPVWIRPTLAGAILSAAQPTKGTVYLDLGTNPNDPADDSLRYVPNLNASGTDTFSYTLTDLFGQSSTATVTVTIAAVNQAPTVADVYAMTAGTTPVAITPLASASDADGDTLTITKIDGQTPNASYQVTLASGAVVTLTSNGSSIASYQPPATYRMSDAFAYTVSDGHGHAVTARVFVQNYGSAAWAVNVVSSTSQASATDGAASKILGVPDALDGSALANAWQPLGTSATDAIVVDFGASAVSATGLVLRGMSGAVSKIESASTSGGAFATLWAGTDTTDPSAFGDFVLSFGATSIVKVRITLDTARNSSNALDAVGLLTGGSTSGPAVLSTRAFDASGRFVVTAFDANALPVDVKSYARGLLVSATTNTYSSVYADHPRIATQTSLYSAAATRVSGQTFDPLSGNPLTEYFGAGANLSTTTYGYDELGRRVSLLDPTANQTTWAYEDAPSGAFARIVTQATMANVNGGATPQAVSSTRYVNALGQVVKIVDANDRRREFTYNADGTRATETWFADATTTTALSTKTFTYTDGVLVSAVDESGTYGYSYDGGGRLIRVVEPVQVLVSGSLTPLSLQFGYDEAGHRNLIVDNLGNREESLYDSSGKLVRRVASNGSVVQRTDQEFDAFGRVIQQRRYPNAAGTSLVATTDYSYDPWTGDVASIVTKNASNTTLSQFDYVYDLTGQLTSQTELQPQLSGSSVTTSFGYDNQGQVTSAGATTYSYDLSGNRATTGADNRLLSDGTWTYKYDAEGSRTEKNRIGTNEKWTYGYDLANHLTSAKHYSSSGTLDLQVDYTYDVLGNRLSTSVGKTSDGTLNSPVVTKFAQDGWNTAKGTPIGNENYDVWADIKADGSLKTRYVRGDAVDELFGRVEYSGSTGTPYWYATDHLGSIRNVIDSGGVVKDAIKYDAFGNATQSNAAFHGRYGWTGREVEVETGLQFNRARFYDPTVGRWISKDPMGFDAGDSNLYRYVSNFVTQSKDPSGFQAAANDLSLAEQATVAILHNAVNSFSKAQFDEVVGTKYGKSPNIFENTKNFNQVQAVLALAAGKLRELVAWTAFNGGAGAITLPSPFSNDGAINVLLKDNISPFKSVGKRSQINNFDDLSLLCHELQHSAQYSKDTTGGQAFLGAYLDTYIFNRFNTGLSANDAYRLIPSEIESYSFEAALATVLAKAPIKAKFESAINAYTAKDNISFIMTNADARDVAKEFVAEFKQEYVKAKKDARAKKAAFEYFDKIKVLIP
jgi:RHS repeat-associated protein